jgi:hypothetical protein
MEPLKTFVARSPLDLVAVVPHLLGFHPEDSVVLLTFGAGDVFHARVDLPAREDHQVDVADMLTEVARRHGIGRVAVLLYTDDPWVAATFHDAVVARLTRAGIEIVDVLRVADGRYHPADRTDDPGTPYDLRSHLFTAEQVVRGEVVHTSRAELAATLQRCDDRDARAVEDAAAAFDERFEGLAAFVTPDRICADIAEHARWLQRTIRRHLRHGRPLSTDEAGRVLVLVAGVPLRDVAWAEMSRDDARAHVELWRDLVRRAPRDLLPAAASLLAFAAWLSGHGALAWCALDRCAEVDPEYSMADCVAGLLERAVPPSVWTPIAEADLPVFWPVSWPPPDLEAS